MDDKAQMMVMETVIFTITILLALAFLFQLSPSSTLTDEYTKELKVQGDDALRALYIEPFTADNLPSNYPSSKLVYYLITNDYDDYDSMTSDLNDMLLNIEYNIWVSNGTNTVFWCNSDGDYNTPLQGIRSVTTSHCLVAIDSLYRNNETGIFSGKYLPGKHDDEGYDINLRSDLDHSSAFKGYEGSTYNVILELWCIS